MFNILNENIPSDGNIIVINVKSGKDRCAFYTWADYHGLNHCPCETILFEPTYIYHCEECGKSSYDNEVSHSTDWSTINPGVSYGEFIQCPNYCETYYHTRDSIDDPNSGGIKRHKVFNTVVIGKCLPKIPKTKTKRVKKYINRNDVDLNILNNIPDCDFKIMNINDFEKEFQDGKEKRFRDNNNAFCYSKIQSNSLDKKLDNKPDNKPDNKLDSEPKNGSENNDLQNNDLQNNDPQNIFINEPEIQSTNITNCTYDKFKQRSGSKGIIGFKPDCSILDTTEDQNNSNLLLNHSTIPQRMLMSSLFDKILEDLAEKKLID
nr:intein containing dna directed rna polymerase subunit 2 [Mimivirus sp.]